MQHLVADVSASTAVQAEASQRLCAVGVQTKVMRSMLAAMQVQTAAIMAVNLSAESGMQALTAVQQTLLQQIARTAEVQPTGCAIASVLRGPAAFFQDDSIHATITTILPAPLLLPVSKPSPTVTIHVGLAQSKARSPGSEILKVTLQGHLQSCPVKVNHCQSCGSYCVSTVWEYNVGKCEVVHFGGKNRKAGVRLQNAAVPRDLLVLESQKVTMQVLHTCYTPRYLVSNPSTMLCTQKENKVHSQAPFNMCLLPGVHLEPFGCLFNINSVTLKQLTDPYRIGNSASHQVPHRREQNTEASEMNAGIPGMWGNWGPWSACSQTCGNGVKEQTRPCLPVTSSNQRKISGHVLSALRPSVPLHRRQDHLKPGLQPSASQNRNESQFSQGILREGGRSLLQGQSLKLERRFAGPESTRTEYLHVIMKTVASQQLCNSHTFFIFARPRTRSSIVPGKYGYGRVPYILPLQTLIGQLSQQAKRQKYQRLRGYGHTQNGKPSAFSHLNLYQGSFQARLQPRAFNSPNHQPTSHYSQTFHLSQGTYPNNNSSSLPSQAIQQGDQDNVQVTATNMISCTGAYKQYRLCNIDSCPQSDRDIRGVQCASYNNQPFMGRFYEWEPFTNVRGHQKCELNCRAVGYRFYVRQAEKVIDGTPCHPNAEFLCVSGQCKQIGCDEYLGSDKLMDKCGICGGDNTACKVISGVFKRSLPSVGYHKIVEIPKGATKINVTEMSKSRNYLALRSRSGRSIINGNWAIDRPGKYEGGGTMFTYKRPNEISSTAGESFLAEGPTNEALDVFMIYQLSNPGIQYEYILPEANVVSHLIAPSVRLEDLLSGQLHVTEDSFAVNSGYENINFQTRHPGRFPPREPGNQVPVMQPPWRFPEYNWKEVGMTECTATCGKGSHYTVFHCVNRNTHEEVSDSLCDISTKPSSEEEACNINSCPAFWDIGEWSECSKTCGLGMQHRQILCRQVYANHTTTVQPYRCQFLAKPETISTCQMKICSGWQIRTEWSSCSVPCGVGQRNRDVKCVSNLGDVVDEEECNMKLRPNDIENCDMGPCAKSWFFTEWSDRCSSECGKGMRSRSVICLTNHISSLPLEGCGNERPSDTMRCGTTSCDSHIQWFTGHWSQCSAECSNGTQYRDVICIRKTQDSFTVVNSDDCAGLNRPPTQQSCYLKPCGSKWFYTEWSTCSKSCEGGFRVREVRCLGDDMIASDRCDLHQKPEEHQSCNNKPCIPQIDESCIDKYYNCNVVVQARLCVYSYYKTACCVSCTRVANRASAFLGHR
ncbi:thrombospondin type-1 domain-containing protein 4-like [Heterodontus francisci]|uniref:thrombospondin type-1 domain-containing protein 4-like n=1 Tax=Heterodontus francisci TaxID=7792 RepID=UPI00355C3263